MSTLNGTSNTNNLPTTDLLTTDKSKGNFSSIIIAIISLQKEITHDFRRATTLLLSGFLVVGILCKLELSYLMAYLFKCIFKKDV